MPTANFAMLGESETQPRMITWLYMQSGDQEVWRIANDSKLIPRLRIVVIELVWAIDSNFIRSIIDLFVSYRLLNIDLDHRHERRIRFADLHSTSPVQR